LTEVCHFANNLGIMQIECGVWIIVIIFWKKEKKNCNLFWFYFSKSSYFDFWKYFWPKSS